jgi:hypothetical protein
MKGSCLSARAAVRKTGYKVFIAGIFAKYDKYARLGEKNTVYIANMKSYSIIINILQT